MIRFRGLTLSRGTRVLLDRAEAAIAPGERIALVGDNGSGKSTLLAAIAGELAPDAGAVEMPPMRTGRLEQSMPRGTQPAWRFVTEADAALVRARAALAEAEASGDGHAIAAAHDDWIACDGASAEARARELLHGLGFGADEGDRPVDAFSGGWKMRLNLARTLMAPADLLLLDEPTNHLDLDAVLWLERRLSRLPATIVVVSHDRDFLDRVATATLHLDGGALVRYAGGYSACEQARAERAAQHRRAVAAQQARISQLHAFVERFRAKATKARQAQSRLKALERIEVLAPLRAARSIDFDFAPVGDCPDPLVRMDGVSAGYPAGDGPARVVLRGVALTVGRGSRLGVLGRNGAGKTTLIRTTVGELAPLAGELQRSRAVRVGYFAQQQVDALDPQASALLHMQRLAPLEREQVLRDWLGRFAFRGDDATRPVGPMSGGERARLALAMLVWQRPQLLVLDEPTNHLDAGTRDALADALAEFDGALLLVSHDRYLLRATVDAFVRVADGAVAPFDGDLDDYAQWLATRPGAPAAAEGPGGVQGATPGEAPAPSRRDERRAAAELRAQRSAQRRPLQQRLAEVERELARAEARIAEIDARLAAPDAYRDGAAAAELGRERGLRAKDRDALEERWLAIGTELESLGDDAGR